MPEKYSPCRGCGKKNTLTKTPVYSGFSLRGGTLWVVSCDYCGEYAAVKIPPFVRSQSKADIMLMKAWNEFNKEVRSE